MIKLKSKICYALLLILFILSFIFKFNNMVFPSIVVLFCIFSLLIIESLFDIKKNYLLIIFYFVFFIFTMGQYIFPNYTNWIYYNQYSNSTIVKTIFIQEIALIITYIGYKISFNFKSHLVEVNLSENFRKFLFCILTFLFILSLIVNFETGFRVMKYGYLIIYSNDVSSIIPGFIKYISFMFPLLSFIMLYLCKKNKEYYLILFMYFVYSCSTLLTGVRGDFCIGMILIFICFVVKKYLVDCSKIKLKKVIIGVSLLIVLLPVSIIGLSIFNSIRNKNSYDKNVFVQFSNFFVNQGSSVNLISMAIENQEELDESKHLYTFGPVIENLDLKLNKFVDIDLIGDTHTSFARDVSMIGLGEEGVNSGQGLGSQYLGELFIDYGYIGIILYSIFLGIILRILSNFYKYNFIGYSLSLVLIQSFLFLPRSQSFQFLNSIISFNYWFLIIIIFMVILVSKRCKKYV